MASLRKLRGPSRGLRLGRPPNPPKETIPVNEVSEALEDPSSSSSSLPSPARRSGRHKKPKRVDLDFVFEGAEREEAEAEDSGDVDIVIVPPLPKGRGRPRKTPKGEIETTTTTITSKSKKASTTITCMSLPVTDKDDEMVECKLCHSQTSLREFRIHNMKMHSNVATTTDDTTTVIDHRFYDRRLKEMKKFTRSKTFKCPTIDCVSSFKSTLGLAYHLETCGKTKEEINSVLIPCDKCDNKFTMPNLAWHKKTHHSENPVTTKVYTNIPGIKNKRKSAIKACQSFVQDLADDVEDKDKSKKKQPQPATASRRKPKDKHDDGEDADYSDDDGDHDGNYDDDGDAGSDLDFDGSNSNPLKSKSRKGNWRPRKSHTKRNIPIPVSTRREFSASAFNFLASKENNSVDNYWNKPERVMGDPLHSPTANNEFVHVGLSELSEYLPQHQESVPFKTLVETVAQPKLEAQISSDYRRLSMFKGDIVDDKFGHFVYNTGGPILGLSWHPSGKYLAISTGSNLQEDIDLKVQCCRKSIIQIYAHHYEQRVEKKSSKPTINALIPKLFICADYGYATSIQWGNFWPLCWDEDNYSSKDFKFTHTIGQIGTSRIGYLGCSFEDGTIRIYSIRMKDCMMPRNFSVRNSSLKIPLYKKIPEICLSIEGVEYPNVGQICRFEWHEDNRFVIAGYCSGVVAIFDVQTTSKLLRETVVENGHPVEVLSPFWIFQAHIAPITAVNFDPTCSRYFITASKDRYLKVWDMHLRKETESRKIGLIQDSCWIRGWIHFALATDGAISNLSAQYNFVRFYQMGATQGRPNCAEFMNISCLSFHNGLTIQATENGNITATYFDNFWREADYDRSKKKHNVVNICKLELDTTSFKRIAPEDFPPDNDQYVPFSFDTTEEPRLLLTFYRQRVRTQNLKDPDKHYMEDYVRFFPYLRINKLMWSPQGQYFATGYRNGLLTIVPATFDSLYDT